MTLAEAAPIPADIAHAIQLSLAPVFLLSAIAGMLNVMANRLSRVIDRGRKLLERPGGGSGLSPDKLAIELRSLERRRYLASAAILTGTLSALLVCTVIAMMFLEVLLGLPLKWLEGVLFASSNIALVLGLAYFAREVHLASRTVRIITEAAPPNAAGAP